MEKAEAEEKKAKALESFYNGEEVAFDKMKSISYGRGKYDTFVRVSKLKCIDKSVSGKKVTVQFTCVSYDTDKEEVHMKKDIQTKYLIDQLI